MADVEKGSPDARHSPADVDHNGDIVLPENWKYKSPKLGSKKIPWFASPEAQITLVALVCFMCPGEHSKLKCSKHPLTDSTARHVQRAEWSGRWRSGRRKAR